MSDDHVPWLPADFSHPVRVQLSCGLHLRPIRATDVDIDLPAVMGSQPRLWSRYGEAWGWPPRTMTAEEDYADLARHEQEIQRHESFNYALLNAEETRLYGCVYLDPLGPGGAEVSWWTVDELEGTPAEAELDAWVPRWVAARWPFGHVSYPFNEVDYPDHEASDPPPELPPEHVDLVRTPLPELDTAAAEALWRSYVSTTADADLGTDYVGAFGNYVELADELIGLVLRGTKRATTALVSEFADEQEPLPRIGSHWLACDGSGTPRVVLRSLELRLGTADSVDDAFAWDEGEGDRTRENWLAAHASYWQRTSGARGDQRSSGSEVVFERFEVVWPPEAVERAGRYWQSVAAHPVA